MCAAFDISPDKFYGNSLPLSFMPMTRSDARCTIVCERVQSNRTCQIITSFDNSGLIHNLSLLSHDDSSIVDNRSQSLQSQSVTGTQHSNSHADPHLNEILDQMESLVSTLISVGKFDNASRQPNQIKNLTLEKCSPGLIGTLILPRPSADTEREAV